MATLNEWEDKVGNAKAVVRSFSWENYADDPDDGLAKSLVKAEADSNSEEAQEPRLKDQWMQLFDPTVGEAFKGGQDEMLLAKPTDELAQVYKNFLKCLPKEHEARIEDGPPRLDVVIKAVKIADAKWKGNREKSKAGRTKRLFTKIPVHLDKYKELAAVVPSGDKYVSLIASSVSAIIKNDHEAERMRHFKATINHEKIAESVSKALDDLSDDIAYWKELMEINEDNMRMDHFVARLYVVVFTFLTTIMTKWLSKSSLARMFRSFDSEFFKEEIEAKKSSIRDLEHKLERSANLSMQRSIRNVIPKAEMKALIADQQAKFQIEWLIKMSQQEAILGRTVKNALEEQYESERQRTQERAVIADPPRPAPDQRIGGERSLMLEGPGSSSTFYTVGEIRLNALRRLRPYTIQLQDIESIVHPQFLNVNIEVFNRIKQLNASSSSQTLWIHGPFLVPRPSRYTQLSATVVMTAQRAKIPTINYFCDSTIGVIDLILSLTAQLVRLLPHDFESTLDFSATRFDTLVDGSPTINQAIRLFRDLLTVGPYMLLIVIDGLQVLDNSSNRTQIQSLVDVLHSASKREPDRVIKTLFTTDGFTDALIRIPGDERMNCMDFASEDGAGPEYDGVEIGFL